MVAANIFNQREENPVSNIYGAVTTGTAWIFLKLAESRVHIDLKETALISQEGSLGYYQP